MVVLDPMWTDAATATPSGDADTEIARLRAHVAWLESERQRLWWAVCHDDLTGLPNRRLFSTMAPAKVCPSQAAIVLLLDLNGFKPINDTHGHETGDRVLAIIGKRLAGCVPDGMVARLGGDEFAGIITSPVEHASPHWWHAAVTTLSAAIAQPMAVDDLELQVTASIGVAPASETTPIDELLHRADMAMYQAKIRGKVYVAWGMDGSTSTATPTAHRPAPGETTRHLAGPADNGVPTLDPYQRNPADIAQAGTYQPCDPIWVHRDGAWCPGVVESASRRFVLVTYRRNLSAGTVADTVSADCVMERTAFDAQLDRTAGIRATAAA